MVVTWFDTDPPSLMAQRGEEASLMFLQPSASGSRYVGDDESLWEWHGRTRIVWGYRNPEMQMQGETLKPLSRPRQDARETDRIDLRLPKANPTHPRATPGELVRGIRAGNERHSRKSHEHRGRNGEMAHHLRASFLFPQTKRVPIHRAFRAEPHCLGCLFLLYAVALAAFVICFFGVVPFYIVLYFEDVAAPWAARPIIHGFKLFLLLSTIAVIPMIVLANYARTESTRRMMKDISSVYCGFTIPLTMLELINIYPAQWSAVDAMVMNQNAWTLYFSTQMLDGITLGHFTHFVTLPDFPTPESLYGKLLLFMMKIYFAAASTWYFYHKIRFRLTGALEITLSPQDLKSWLPRWASASSVDATKVRIKAIAVEHRYRKTVSRRQL